MPDVQDPDDVLALLSSLKTRLLQTSESLRELLEALHSGPQQAHSWDSLLGSAGVLSARLGAVEAESAAAASLLGTLLVHPHTLPQGDPDLCMSLFLGHICYGSHMSHRLWKEHI